MGDGGAHNNIYNYRKADSIMYMVFYIIIPVMVTALSLFFFPDMETAAAYSYMTILVSALNCIYDAYNRWVSNKKTVVNTKLAVMIIPLVVVAVYCFFEVMYILLAQKADCRMDWILCIYFVTIGVALFDFVPCFASEMSLGNYTKS